MGRNIYNRFETLIETAGSPGNMLYEARDLADGSTVQLLEWTPAPAVFDDCLARLVAAQNDVPEVQVFSSPPSLYIASPSAIAALDAMRKLQSTGLFPGNWPGAASNMSTSEWNNYWELQKKIAQIGVFDPQGDSTIGLTPPAPVPQPVAPPPLPVLPGPMPVPPGPPPPPPRPVQPKPRRASKPLGWLLPAVASFLVVLLLAAGVGWAWRERSRRMAEQQRQEQARLLEIQRQREAQRKAEEAKADAEKHEKELADQLAREEQEREAALANERQQKEEAEARLRQQQEQEAQKERERIAAAAAEKERQENEARTREAQRRIEIANAQAAQKRKDDLDRAREQDRVVRASAKAITDSFAQRQMSLSTALNGQYHRLRLVNKCDSVSINVAVRFQALDNTWVTQGWWQLDPHQERAAPLVYSRNGTFYFYAEGGDQVWSGSGPDALSMQIVENPFTHLMDPIVGKNPRVVKAMRRDYTTGYGEHIVPFSCQ